MPQRETQIESRLQQWRGVDQRTQPTLVQDGFFVSSRGVFFGLGDNAERIPGKTLFALIGAPVFNIFQFGNVALLQTFSSLKMLEIVIPPAPPPPTGGEPRITEAGDNRITETGDQRVTD